MGRRRPQAHRGLHFRDRLRQPALSRPDDGSAVAEFALGAGLLVLVAGLALSLCVLGLARASATRCAAQGARAGALHPGAPGPGAQDATRDCLSAAVPGGAAAGVAVEVEGEGDAHLVHVVVDLPVPLPAGPATRARVHGHAWLDER